MISELNRSLPNTSLEPLSTRRCLTLAAALVLLGLAALLIDVPLARLVQDDGSPTFLRKICGFAEIFGHGVGVAALLVVIAVFDPLRRVSLPRIGAAALGAGLTANLCKLLISRQRPRSVDFGLVERGVDTFGDWLPLAGNGSGGQGFPSSHMATAAAFCIVLAAYYPRARWLFAGCAALSGLQRILSDAHFASDVLWGATVGCLIAPLFLHGPVSAAFDRLETKWRGNHPQPISAKPAASPRSKSAA